MILMSMLKAAFCCYIVHDKRVPKDHIPCRAPISPLQPHNPIERRPCLQCKELISWKTPYPKILDAEN